MQVHSLISSENGPIILWVMYPHRGDELEHTADSIRELVGEEQFTLVAIILPLVVPAKIIQP